MPGMNREVADAHSLAVRTNRGAGKRGAPKPCSRPRSDTDTPQPPHGTASAKASRAFSQHLLRLRPSRQRGDGSPITTTPRLTRPHDAVPGRGRYVLRHRIEAEARATRLDALAGPRPGELKSVQRDAARRSRYRLRAASFNRLADRRSDSSTEHGAQREGTVDERFTDVQSASEPGAATPLTAATGECSNGPCARPASSPRAQPRPGFALMLRVAIALAFLVAVPPASADVFF